MKNRRQPSALLSLVLALLLLAALALLAGRAAQLPSPELPALAARRPGPSPTPHVHRFEDGTGRCADCGTDCDHAAGFDGEGRCLDCGWLCPHETHDPGTAACPVCGAQFNHHFGMDGVCDLCGAEAPLYTAPLPAAYYVPAAHSGRCLTETLKDAAGIERTIAVWLPWDYSAETRFNVVLLIHGDGGSCRDWTDETLLSDLGELHFCTVYDNIVERHLCDPFLIVGLNNVGMENALYGERFVEETVLPHLARQYSTWMEGDSPEQIAAARRHIAIGGLSRGSIYTYTFGMTQCLDVAANFCCFSNGYDRDVTRRLRSGELQDLDYLSYVASVGLKDDAFTVREHRQCYNTLCNSVDALRDGENARFLELETGHDFLTWTTSLYDALLLMF